MNREGDLSEVVIASLTKETIMAAGILAMAIRPVFMYGAEAAWKGLLSREPHSKAGTWVRRAIIYATPDEFKHQMTMRSLRRRGLLEA